MSQKLAAFWNWKAKEAISLDWLKNWDIAGEILLNQIMFN